MIAFLRTRSGNRLLSMAAAWVAIAVCAFGCVGGSGSSGFDLAESSVIQRVGQGQECEEFDGLIICPADATRGSAATPTHSVPPTAPPAATPSATETTSAPGTATPAVTGTIPQPQGTSTPTASPAAHDTAAPTAIAATPTHTATGIPSATPSPTAILETDIFTNASGLHGGAACAPSQEPSMCDVEFRFRAIGLPDTSAFRVAARPVDTVGAWSIFVPTRTDGTADPFDYSSEIRIDVADAQAAQSGVQVIVLVFDSDPGPVPERVARLSDTGADRAFVVAVLPVLSP